MAIRKVLLVEDEPILAENLQAYLETRRCEVCIARDGAGALLLAANFGPDILVLDYRLPDMDAFQVLDALRGRYDGERVLMTGHPSGEICEGAARRGIVHILLKPFPLADLARVVCKPQVLGRVRSE
ncbi:response regulator [Azotobacter beijerinckii]|uniref:Response regulator receiver domain-containing protein n=1 Tax=Azotobacter beijerinckii TaxID=170623 RepID=A0A1I4ESM3_9GAMM|nr:response regulator [Azotobacter beijerinckii]SFB50631.1 Response regulator receiver domain-containing protein [Azotobacter beijerinckii]SFL08100.1 Response regulator receiver domain-containing protein [Azotobacter beijerinckii]